MKKMNFSITINAPKEEVWDAMLSPDSFREWTEEFMPGSYYEGSWEKGAKIRFLAPDGEGMTSEIAENRPYAFVSIKHLGFVRNGIEDTGSEEVRSWAPAFENYSFSERNGVTDVRVEMDANDDDEAMFRELWPKALAKLKRICEE